MSTPYRKKLLMGLMGATTAAVLFVLACPPISLTPLAWLVPGLLMVSVRGLPVRHAGEAGLLFGVVSAGLVDRWLPAYVAAGLETLGFSPSPIFASLVAFAGIIIGAGLPCAAVTALYAVAARRVKWMDLAIAGAFLWVGGEWVRAQVFGWQLIGHSQFRELWLIQIADLGGVLAVSFVVAFASIAACESLDAVLRGSVRVAGAARALILPVAAIAVALVHGVASRAVYSDAVSVDLMQSPASEFASGSIRLASTAEPLEYSMPQLRIRQVSLVEHSGVRVGPLLCEDMFDAGIVHRVVADGADVLINNCRVGWLTNAVPATVEQHLSQAVFRAVESRRFLVRSTPDGDAQLITADGQVHAETPVGRTLSMSSDTTRYMWAGDRWILFGFAASMLVIGRGNRAAR